MIYNIHDVCDVIIYAAKHATHKFPYIEDVR